MTGLRGAAPASVDRQPEHDERGPGPLSSFWATRSVDRRVRGRGRAGRASALEPRFLECLSSASRPIWPDGLRPPYGLIGCVWPDTRPLRPTTSDENRLDIFFNEPRIQGTSRLLKKACVWRARLARPVGERFGEEGAYWAYATDERRSRPERSPARSAVRRMQAFFSTLL